MSESLPLPATSFVGRERERKALSEMLDGRAPVTVTGCGGVGKTRLASEVAVGAASRFSDGVRMVELASIRKPAGVWAALAAGVGVTEEPGVPISWAVLDRLRSQQVLVVLDNCEHLLAECAAAVEALTGACAGLRVLATSRQPLGVPGERVWPLEPLAVPEISDDAGTALRSDWPALRMFCDRAEARLPGFVLTADNVSEVVELCRRLDGLPLAIELATARIGALAPAQILDRLDGRFGLLSHDDADPGDRHGSLHRTLAWSYDLLTVPEAILFRRLAVFDGGWSLEAAEEVCGSADLPRARVPRVLASLVDKSLVVAQRSAADTRYRFLETIRAFAAERQAAAEGHAERQADVVDDRSEDQLRERHAAWCLGLIESAEPELRGPRRAAALARVSADHDNLRAALHWMLSSGRHEQALRGAAALAPYWRGRRLFSEGLESLTTALDVPDTPSDLRAGALRAAGQLLGEAGRYAESLDPLNEALRLAEAAGDLAATARTLRLLGYSRLYLGDVDAALAELGRSVDAARQAGDLQELLVSLNTSGVAAMFVGDAVLADGRFNEGLKVSAEIGDPEPAWPALAGLGWAALVSGRFDKAEERLEEVKAVARSASSDEATGVALGLMGELARVRGDYATAHRVLAEALALAGALDASFSMSVRLTFLGRTFADEGDVAQALAHFDRAAAVARKAGVPSALAMALRGLGTAQLDGDVPEARSSLEEALRISRRIGDRRTEAYALLELARSCPVSDADDGAVPMVLGALTLLEELGDPLGVISGLETLASVRARQGWLKAAARLLAAATTARDANGFVRPPSRSRDHGATVAAVAEGLGPEAWSLAWDEGAKVRLDDAVAYASRGRGRRVRQGSGWASLTDTERTVAELLVQRLTNREIAERLLVSPRTVESHVSRVLAKLKVPSRRELAADAPGRPEA